MATKKTNAKQLDREIERAITKLPKPPVDEPMWKLLIDDDRGRFETWEIGDTAEEAIGIAKARRGSFLISIQVARDGDGAPIVERAPCSGEARRAWDVQHADRVITSSIRRR